MCKVKNEKNIQGSTKYCIYLDGYMEYNEQKNVKKRIDGTSMVVFFKGITQQTHNNGDQTRIALLLLSDVWCI